MVRRALSVLVLSVIYLEVKNDDVPVQQYGQSLQRSIPTEIIDLPDDTKAQQTLQNGLGWYPRIPTRDKLQVVPTNTLPSQSLNSAQPTYPWTTGNFSWPKDTFESISQGTNQGGYNFPSAYPFQYNQGSYPFPYSSPSNPYVYRPFYPSDYIRYYYPSLYQQFPNGFYVLPASENIGVSSKVLPSMRTEPRPQSNVGRSGINIDRYLQDANKYNANNAAQPTTYQIFNHTKLGERKSFVSRVELKPVSTKFVRFNGRDGKAYLKLLTTDGDGKEQVSESEYTGNINLKITNGVLETPHNSTNELEYKEGNKDPNSITVDAEAHQEEPETGEPDDITSWNM